ncbi:hypothetical protein QT994_22490 [Microcoleus sp. S13_B4]
MLKYQQHYTNPKSFVNFLLPSERVRGGVGWGKKFTTPARIAISAPKKLAQPKPQSRLDHPIALRCDRLSSITTLAIAIG